jgi:anti-sigma-K factor RskA
VVCAGLAKPASNGAYQVWLVHDEDAISAGVLPAGKNAGTMLISGLRGASAVAISLEPAGGSTHPTRRIATVSFA